MTMNTTSGDNGTADITSAIPTAPEVAKPTRKRRMAREPGETLAAAPGASTTSVAAEAAPSPSSQLPTSVSKTTTILTLLRRDDGATLEEMIAATGWLPHTTRAVLTGLRRKGHVIERGKRDDVTTWRITGEA